MTVHEYLLFLLTHYHQLTAETRQAQQFSDENEKFLYLSRAKDLDRLRYAVSGLLPKYRTVLQALYFRKETWQCISDKYHISHKTIAAYRKKGLEQLESIWELNGLKKLAAQKDMG